MTLPKQFAYDFPTQCDTENSHCVCVYPVDILHRQRRYRKRTCLEQWRHRYHLLRDMYLHLDEQVSLPRHPVQCLSRVMILMIWELGLFGCNRCEISKQSPKDPSNLYMQLFVVSEEYSSRERLDCDKPDNDLTMQSHIRSLIVAFVLRNGMDLSNFRQVKYCKLSSVDLKFIDHRLSLLEHLSEVRANHLFLKSPNHVTLCILAKTSHLFKRLSGIDTPLQDC